MALLTPHHPLVLLPVLALAALSSLSDVREGKIRNRHVLPFLLLGLGRILLLDDHWARGLANAGASLAAGFLLWHLGLWSAGDAKLFLAFAALVPLNEETMRYNAVYGFPSLMVLVNTFVPLFLLMLGRLLFLTPLGLKTMLLRRVFEPRQVAAAGAALFVLSWLGGLLLGALGLPSSAVADLFLMFALIEVAERVAPRRSLHLYLALSLARLALDPLVRTPAFALGFAALLVSFLLLRTFVIYMGHHYYSTPCPVDALEEGMMPSEGVVEREGRYEKVELLTVNLLSALRLARLDLAFGSRATGLSAEEVARLKALHKEDKLGFDELLVQQTTPFAPLLSAGVLITLAFRGDPIAWLKAVHGASLRAWLPTALSELVGV